MEACCHFCRSRRREEMRAVPVVTIPLSRTSINQPLLSSTTHIPSKVNLFLIENVMMLLVLVVFRLLWMLCWIFILMNLVLYIMMCFSLWLQVLQKLLRDNYYSNYTSCNSFVEPRIWRPSLCIWLKLWCLGGCWDGCPIVQQSCSSLVTGSQSLVIVSSQLNGGTLWSVWKYELIFNKRIAVEWKLLLLKESFQFEGWVWGGLEQGSIVKNDWADQFVSANKIN